jgi:ABC-type uncharacterized transport system permease subunit
MLGARLAIAATMVILGLYLIYRMLHYPLAQSFTGLVLGGAMIALGVLRLRQVRSAWTKR